MRKANILGLLFLVLGVMLVVSAVVSADVTDELPITRIAQADPTPQDHAGFEALEGPFETGPEVTAACLICHTDAAEQLQHTTHWTWEFEDPTTGDMLGKRNVINNFCVSVETNEPRCTSCHIGYGYTSEETFDFSEETNVDCLVCHDTTGTYVKWPAGAGHPAYETIVFDGKTFEPVDLALVAQNVGPTSRESCGSCHFSGGGGDAVKHGDLDSSLIHASAEIDVHMAEDGLNFTCTTCHTTVDHSIPGSRYEWTVRDEGGIDVPGNSDGDRATCESCHGLSPHEEHQYNRHVSFVACQTCHIPTVARQEATKTEWDWSQAGQFNAEGKPFQEVNDVGYVVYDSKKGAFEWVLNYQPELIWFNGDVDWALLEDEIDPSQTVVINWLNGSYEDDDSRLWPVKAFHAVLPYDATYNRLVTPHLFPTSPDDSTAYWKNWDWDAAIQMGMDAKGADYSGDIGWVDTVMYWPQTHMVAPASEALTCEHCHEADDSLIEDLWINSGD